MLLGLDDDPYSYDDIIDNLWPFKTKNKRKENEYVQFLTYNMLGNDCCLREMISKFF
jgi:hypothetical protein